MTVPDPAAGRELQRLLYSGRRHGLFGSAALHCFSTSGGAATWQTGVATFYDLASLTKPLVTAPLILRDIAQGALALDSRLGDVLPAARGRPAGGISIEALLRHRGGLPAWKPWYAHAPTPEALIDAVTREPVSNAPSTCYSDAGFILLGALASRRESLATRLATELAPAVGLNSGEWFWYAAPDQRRHTAPAGFCAWRRRLVWAEVHDANASVLRERAGHAGLFGTIEGVARLCRYWLEPDTQQVLPAPLLRRAVEIPPAGRPLGWDRTGPGPSQAGDNADPALIGHLGFTGTSAWLDPPAGRGVILLTNRIIAPGNSDAFRAWRKMIHERLWALWPRSA